MSLTGAANRSLEPSGFFLIDTLCSGASENNLGTLIGVEAAGWLIPGSGFKVGHGYMLIIPKAEYIT